MRHRRSDVLLASTMICVVLGFVFHASPWIAGGLGDSHDGYNAAVWGLGARGAVEDPIGNRLGGVHPDGFRYASHPPLLVWTLTPVVAVKDKWPLGLRLVPAIASIAALGILAALLLDAGLSHVPTAVGVLLAGSSAMMLTFGAMVDTPVFGFPFALAAVWVAQRAWQNRPPPMWVTFTCGALAALSGWQALLAAVIAGAVAAARRPGGIGRKAGLLLLGGIVGGLAIDAAWIYWVMGSFNGLLSQGVSRTEMDIASWFSHQSEFASDLYGPVLLVTVLVGGAVALISPAFIRKREGDANSASAEAPISDRSPWNGTRPLFAVLLVVVIGYALIFRLGSWVHSYWNFYGIALVAVAAGTFAQTTMVLIQRLSSFTRSLSSFLLILICLIIAGTSWMTRSLAEVQTQIGMEVVPLLDQVPVADRPTDVVVATVGGDPTKPWLRWSRRGRNQAVDPDRLSDLDPRMPVLLSMPVAQDPSSWEGTGTTINGHFALLEAAELDRLFKG